MVAFVSGVFVSSHQRSGESFLPNHIYAFRLHHKLTFLIIHLSELRSFAQMLLLQEGWKELFILSAAQYGLSGDFGSLLEYHGLNASSGPDSAACSPVISAAHSPALSPVPFGSTGSSGSPASSSYLHDGSLCESPRKSSHSLSCQTSTLSGSVSSTTLGSSLPFARTPPSGSQSPPELHSPQTPPNSVQPLHGGLTCTAGCTPNEGSRCSCLNANCGSDHNANRTGSGSADRSASSHAQFLAEIAHFTEILDRFKQNNVDPIEFSCLKAISLFKTSKSSYLHI